MPDIFGAPSPSRALRWVTFFIVEANVAFMYVYDRVHDVPSISDVSNQYATTFAPADFVYLAYWVIGAAFLLFYVAALWPRPRRTHTFDPFVVPIAVASTLASAWVVAFRNDEIGLALTLTGAGAVVGNVMFVRATASPSRHSRWLRVPFALYFGWMTFALLVGIAQWLNAHNWLTTVELVTTMSLALIAIAALAGIAIALVYREFVYPAVLAWGAGGIYAGQRLFDSTVAHSALYVAAGLLIVAGLAVVATAMMPARPETRAEAREAASAEARVNVARLGHRIRWPRFRTQPRPILDARHRRYLVDLDAATTGMGPG
jgi:benzodiazapine receptor